MKDTRFRLGLLVAMFVLCGLAVGPAGAVPPTTGPDLVPDLPAGDQAILSQIAAQLSQRQWGPADVETFEKPPEKGKEVWKAVNGKLSYKDGRLIVDAAAEADEPMWVQRKVAERFVNSDNLRIDLWMETGSLRRVAVNPNGENYRLGLFLGASVPEQPMQWEYNYSFAIGYPHSVLQQFQCITGEGSRNLGGPGDVVKADKLMHIRMEIVETRVAGQRDSSEGVTIDNVAIRPLKIDKDMMVGVFGQASKIRLVKFSCRALAPATQPEQLAGLWKKTSFGGPEALTTWLNEKVIPHLGAARYRDREKASKLLEDTWPLSRPAVEAAMKNTALGAESMLRLKVLMENAPATKIEDPPPGEAPKPPPLSAGEATTQPDEDVKPAGPADPNGVRMDVKVNIQRDAAGGVINNGGGAMKFDFKIVAPPVTTQPDGNVTIIRKGAGGMRFNMVVAPPVTTQPAQP